MIHELRLYTVVPGRMDVAFRRFKDHLPALFARHGIRNVGRWSATAGPDGPMFAYMMTYEDLAERERQWTGFYGDPEWSGIRARTQGDEEATERFAIHFLRPSPFWTPPGDPQRTVGGVHDLVFSEIALGKAGAANAFLADTYLPALRAAGAEIMLAADFVSGPALPRIALMFAWRDGTARQDGWRRLGTDPALHHALSQQRRAFGRALLGRTDTYVLEPTDFALPQAHP